MNVALASSLIFENMINITRALSFILAISFILATSFVASFSVQRITALSKPNSCDTRVHADGAETLESVSRYVVVVFPSSLVFNGMANLTRVLYPNS
jgi:hypothetical protein